MPCTSLPTWERLLEKLPLKVALKALRISAARFGNVLVRHLQPSNSRLRPELLSQIFGLFSNAPALIAPLFVSAKQSSYALQCNLQKQEITNGLQRKPVSRFSMQPFYILSCRTIERSGIW